MRPRVNNPAYAAHVAAQHATAATPSADALAASIVKAPSSADAVTPTTSLPNVASGPSVGPSVDPAPVLTPASLPAEGTVLPEQPAAGVSTGVEAEPLGSNTHDANVASGVAAASAAANVVDDTDASAVAAFNHPAVVKYLAELDAYYTEEMDRLKANAKAAIAAVGKIFHGAAGNNDVHANNSIDSVNAASPTAPKPAAS